MDTLAIVTATLSATVTLVAIGIGYILAKRREHESDWRKVKLTLYQEFMASMSGVVRERATAESHRRYADAVNSLNLVAPSAVHAALIEFQKEISHLNGSKSDTQHDILLANLIRAMRRDIHPGRLGDESNIPFRLFGIPPEAR